MQRHRTSFFGQKVGVILDSADQTDAYLFMRFLRKKADNTWEKISEREGKSIKINLLEIIAIRDVFEKINTKWSTVHKYANESTVIGVENQQGVVNMSAGGYNKQFRYPETVLCEKLLGHILEEKIAFATNNEKQVSNQETDASDSDKTDNKANNDSIIKKSEITKATSQSNAPLNEPEDFEEPPINQNAEVENPFDAPESKSDKSAEKKPPTSRAKPSNTNKTPGTLNIDPSVLQHRGDFSFVPGVIISQRPKAVSFKNKEEEDPIWIPISVIEGLDQAQTTQGLWIKDWFLKKIVVLPLIQF